MKSFLFVLILCIAPLVVNSQVVYFEDFGIGCTTGTLATTFGWTVTNTGANEASANIWYVSANERGVGAGNCGIGCGGTQSRTLHLSAAGGAGGDLGAAYFESSAFTCGFLGLCSITDKRVESPTINCSGISAIPLTFDYIENGEGINDDCTVWYSANNGGTWTLLDNPPKTAFCGAQGLWAARNLVLPASANNNPTVKVGFRWVNNGNGSGTDPSFAVDNIQVGTPIVLGVDMVNMTVNCDQSTRIVYWTTQNEINSDHFNVYVSSNASDWELLDRIPSNNHSGLNSYEIIDRRTGNYSTSYYYIEQVDIDGKGTSYSILSSENCTDDEEIKIFPNPSNGNELTIVSSKKDVVGASILSIEGKNVGIYNNETKSNYFKIYPNLPSGTYFVEVRTTNGVESLPLTIH